MSCRQRLVAALLASAALLAAPAAAPALVLVPVGTFAAPVEVRGIPGDVSRLLIAEQRGVVRLVRDGVAAPAPFLDIEDLVTAEGGERGLLSVLPAPDWARSGLAYVLYTARDPEGAVTVAEYRRAADDPDRLDPRTARTLLTIPHPQRWHSGGQLAFDAAGLLHIATGDGGGIGDPAANGQNLDDATGTFDGVRRHPLLGKLLRVDPRPGDGCGGACTIPAGQPVAPGAAPEIFAIGLRNPWRIAFDSATGDLVIGDVGQDVWEEIDRVPAGVLAPGLNFGWSRREGPALFNAGVALALPGRAPVEPVLAHRHPDGWCSITGGVVVRDPALPELAGRYVYGDYCDGPVRAAALSDAGPVPGSEVALPVVDRLSSFGEDACGRVHLASTNGVVARLAADEARAPCTGERLASDPAGTSAAGAPAGPRPVLRLRGVTRRQPLRTGVIALRVTCSAICDLTVRGVLRRGSAPRAAASWAALAPVRRVLPAGRAAIVRVRISAVQRRIAARALTAGRRVDAHLTFDVTGAARPRRTLAVRLVP